MCPGLSHLCGVIRKSAGPRHAISVFFLALGFCGLCNAQQASPPGHLGRLTPLSIEQVRDAVLLAPPNSELSLHTKQLKVTRRPDLEDLLALVHVRGPDSLYLYQVEIPAQASFDGPWTWIIAAAAQRQGTYELYSFESEAKRADVAGEFNRFASQLSLSLSKYDAANFAAFFLETAIPTSPGEIVLDQETLRDAVGLHYFITYDEVWRSLDAYAQWSEALSDREKMLAFAPRTEIEQNGRYLVTLNRVVKTEGTHPQLQQWQVEISLEGNVRVTAMRAILPTAARWIFYDSPEQPNVMPFRP